jgi:hypothetical protein
MHSRTLWKDRREAAHAPGEDSPDNSSARSRQATQQQVEMAYVHALIMSAHDWRVLDSPLEKRLRSRTCEVLAWAETTLPIINQSFCDARTQLHTGHQDILTYFSEAIMAPVAIATTLTSATLTSTARTTVLLLDIRQRFQSARTRMATLSSDIHQFFPQQCHFFPQQCHFNPSLAKTDVHELTSFSTGRGFTLAAGPGRTFPIVV